MSLKTIRLGQHRPHIRPLRHQMKRVASAVVGAVAIATLSALPSLADPFRATDAHNIDDRTEDAFYAMFRDGNYVEARRLLATASSEEPLSHAMGATFSYLDQDWDALKGQADNTLQAAAQLAESDPLRSHLYTAIGHFMEGAYIFSTENTVTAIPKSLGKLSQVLSNMQAAESIDDTDPELNLLKGYMDLMISVLLPRSNPEDAIERLTTHAQPDYLVNRGIAIAYRDLGEHDKALDYVEDAIEITPQNPDLLYLKGQILRNKADDLDADNQQAEREATLTRSVRSFNQAFRMHSQLPNPLAAELGYELCRAQNILENRNRNCRNWTANRLASSTQSTPDPAN